MHIGHLYATLRSFLAQFGFAAVISPVSAADKAKIDDFDLWHDLDLTCDLFQKILKFIKKYSLRAFYCRFAHLVTAAGSLVSRVGGGG